LNYLYCSNNKITVLEGVENLVELIKNNKNIINNIICDFIEKMIIELNGYQKCILK
jgi:hypothetical protein